jgi:hypothetical protein
MTKSKGHIAFAGEYELFKHKNGDIYRANRTNPITADGYKNGARFESTPAAWSKFGKLRISQLKMK